MTKIVEKALLFAEEFFKNEFSGHDYYHTVRVYNNSMMIAQSEECDVELVSLASILHDVDDYKIVDEGSEELHNAKTFLRANNYSEERIELICRIISQISFKANDSVIPDTIEGKIVQDADRLDALGAIGIARTFAYGGNHNIPIYNPSIEYRENMTAEEYRVQTGSTINHFYEKLLLIKDLMNTDTAKDIAEARHEYMLKFLEEFYKEWNGQDQQSKINKKH